MKTTLRILALPLLTATVVGLAGCQTGAPGNRTAGRMLDDDTITSKIETALDNSPVYKFNTVHVSTYDGVVQLSGWAQTDEQKEMAGKLARTVPGVTDVVNSISLVQGNPAKREAATTSPAASGGASEGPSGTNEWSGASGPNQ